MQVGERAGGGAAGVEDDDAHLRARLLGGGEALVEDRVAPGEVGADEDHEVGLLEVLVGAGHGVRAEGAAVAGDRGGHAEAGVGVDVGRADEALHQLVGDVVVLGQQLARAVDRDAVRAVRVDGGAERRGDQVEGLVPAGVAAVDAGGEQAVLEPEGLAERGALGAEPAEVRRVLRVAGDGGAAAAVGGRQHAAADAAIGAGGANRGGHRDCGCARPHDDRLTPSGASCGVGALRRCPKGFTGETCAYTGTQYGMRMESIWPRKTLRIIR